MSVFIFAVHRVKTFKVRTINVRLERHAAAKERMDPKSVFFSPPLVEVFSEHIRNHSRELF